MYNSTIPIEVEVYVGINETHWVTVYISTYILYTKTIYEIHTIIFNIASKYFGGVIFVAINPSSMTKQYLF